jgi:hypothetical protein
LDKDIYTDRNKCHTCNLIYKTGPDQDDSSSSNTQVAGPTSIDRGNGGHTSIGRGNGGHTSIDRGNGCGTSSSSQDQTTCRRQKETVVAL